MTAELALCLCQACCRRSSSEKSSQSYITRACADRGEFGPLFPDEKTRDFLEKR